MHQLMHDNDGEMKNDFYDLFENMDQSYKYDIELVIGEFSAKIG